MRTVILFLFLLALTTGPSWGAEIVEIRIDEPGSNDNEYFELRGAPGESLDGWTYMVIGDGPSGDSGIIEAVVDLTGLSIPADGYFLYAEATFVGPQVPDQTGTLRFENVDNVTHLLVSGFTGTVGDDLDSNDDCSLDTKPWATEANRVAIIVEQNPPSNTECHYGPPIAGNHLSQRPGHVFLCGQTWFIGPFTYPTKDTPGSDNDDFCPVATGLESWGMLKSRY